MHVCRAELEHMHFYQVPSNADTTLLPGLCESLLLCFTPLHPYPHCSSEVLVISYLDYYFRFIACIPSTPVAAKVVFLNKNLMVT